MVIDLEIPNGSIPIKEAITCIPMDDDIDHIYCISINDNEGNHLRVQCPFDGKDIWELWDQLMFRCLEFDLCDYSIISISNIIQPITGNQSLISYEMTLSSEED